MNSIILAINSLLIKADLEFSLLFYNKNINHFYGENNIWCYLIYQSIGLITIILISGSLFFFLLGKKFSWLNYNYYKPLVITTSICLIIGPGLIINTILKNHWGRPRPYQVVRDHHPYRQFWQANFSAPQDNSFPSGHAAIGFFVGIPFYIARKKKLAIVISLSFGLGVGLVRIMQGGHFLSDVLFSGIIVWIISVLIIHLIKIFTTKVSDEI